MIYDARYTYFFVDYYALLSIVGFTTSFPSQATHHCFVWISDPWPDKSITSHGTQHDLKNLDPRPLVAVVSAG